MSEKLKAQWAAKLQPLVGKKIRSVRYLTEGECADMMFDKSAVVLELEDGTLLWPMADDEGNNGGALFIQPSTAARKAGLPDAAPTI